ncbi:hypothetical protein [Nocardioides soli]|uniref:Uncharacterized protein n=1 Tax=Nocardioides soli TaxID=1036020 RepID=A0A7W4VSY8_9ACTN|nr:hypothetical protein [Nocardioides soli]MBB3041183.1 hypothetical protein [Nocardioides soli]
MTRPSYVATPLERVLWDSRNRDRQAILAMQRRQDVWWRGWGILRRKPWRASHGPQIRGRSPRVALSNLRRWLRAAHDCQDPAVACTCAGSFRFPTPDLRRGVQS